MGLDTTHGCWHGAYSAFSRWRTKLAEVAGYTIHKSDYGYLIADIDWGGIHRTIGVDLSGKWPAIPVRPDGTPDALMILIAHSDCDGEIEAKYCGPLADRLTELLPLLDGDGGGHVGDFRAKTQTFIDGLRLAAAANESVVFH